MSPCTKYGERERVTAIHDISDGVCAYLQGGFGNQLFILAAAWEQAERLDCPLYVDTSRFLAGDPLDRAYHKETPRHFELGSLEFPGVVLGEDSPWYRNSPRRPAVIRQPGRRSRSLKVFRQPSLNYHPEINDIVPGTTLLGYFQSWKYFEGISEQVASALEHARLTPEENSRITELATTETLTAHVRRGDYLTREAAFHHGIASADYFNRALHLLRQLTDQDLLARVYSDSPDIVQRELTDPAHLEFITDTDSMGSLATVLAMSQGVGFAMSNSSFSWWAAWLLSRRSPAAPVIAPRPWLADGQSGHDQLLPGWLTLDAR